MSSSKKFFSGNTLEQAVLQAARFFQIDPDLVAYEPVERRHGFLKVRRRVVIGVDQDHPRRSAAVDSGEKVAVEEPATPQATESRTEPQSAKTEPVREQAREAIRPRAPQTPKEVGVAAHGAEEEREDAWKDVSAADGVEAAEEALRRVFRLGELDLSAEVSATESGLQVEVGGPDEDQLFEDRGRLLLAIEHLVPRMVRGLTGGSVACRVDSDNFHEVRAEQLRMLAQDAAAEVRRAGRMQTLEPMSPDERRIVHLTLAEDPAVDTESHGTGLFKRVAVRPIRSPRGRDDRYSR